MDKTSFYAYLSSFEGLDEYPAIKHSTLTNSIRPELFLNGEPEVLLAIIIFTLNIITLRGRDESYFLDLLIREILISAYSKNKHKIKPKSFSR